MFLRLEVEGLLFIINILYIRNMKVQFPNGYKETPQKSCKSFLKIKFFYCHFTECKKYKIIVIETGEIRKLSILLI